MYNDNNQDIYGDITFFTNKGEDTLKNRFISVLNSHTQYFDVLVGYFRTSGFNELYESIEKVEKTRILVGLNVDKNTVNILDKAKRIQTEMDLDSNSVSDEYSKSIIREMNDATDDLNLKTSVDSFIKLLINKKIEIRVYPHAPLHSKVYIMRKNRKEVPDTYGSVITGSSNFSKSGLINNLEFNVELKDSRDVKFALKRFEELWEQGLEVTEEYVDTIKNKTWLNEESYTPEQLFYKLLSDYFEAELNDEVIDYYLPSEFKALKYQEDAIKRAREILNAYNGVFISDVVGLGKTYICAMLSQILEPGKKLIICPPVLVEYWKQVFLEFNVSATVISMGKLDSILESNYHQYKYVFVDEAHRFRNQSTDTYQKLHQICFNKKVILISATPQNNKIDDLANLIYLFQQKNNSNIIPNVKNLEKFFNNLIKKYKELDISIEEDKKELQMISRKIQDKVLRNIMVRRTRSEIKQYYADDLKKQNLSFPIVNPPKRITYMLDEELDNIFNLTISSIKKLTYARYKPLTYIKNQAEFNLSTLLVGQQNMGGFMKALLVKRLESSFHAFKQTIDRFIKSHKYAIKMYNDNSFYVGEKINVYDLIESGREEKIDELLEDQRLTKYSKVDFKESFINDLISDVDILEEIKLAWTNVTKDPKLDTLISSLKDFQSNINDKIIIFSESAETVEYLQKKLINNKFNSISFTGNDKLTIKRVIEEHFNPNIESSKKDKEKIDILITSDILSEGINLHNSNVIINYDLPWNPTRIMQRVGRVNRVGTKHSEIFIANFFPTDQSHSHLTLEENIITKIQSFHDLLGEDAKYLTDEEVISSHKIFGKNLLTNIDEAIGEDEESINESELKYLALIRNIKENNYKLYKKISSIPNKIRCAVLSEEEFTLTYIKQNSLKKFFSYNNNESNEISFINAAAIFEDNIKSKQTKLDQNYFAALEKNIGAYLKSIEEEKKVLNQGKIRTQNDLKIISILKTLIKISPQEKIILNKYIELWQDGVVPKALSNKIINIIKKERDIKEILKAIKITIPESYLDYRKDNVELLSTDNNEVVLSIHGREAKSN